MSKKHRQIISNLLFVVFVFYYANICFFNHTHIINGVTIVHSHLYSKAHMQMGTHSDSELTLISTLSFFQSFQATLGFVYLGLFLILQAVISSSYKNLIVLKSTACISLRAPPSLY